MSSLVRSPELHTYAFHWPLDSPWMSKVNLVSAGLLLTWNPCPLCFPLPFSCHVKSLEGILIFFSCLLPSHVQLTWWCVLPIPPPSYFSTLFLLLSVGTQTCISILMISLFLNPPPFSLPSELSFQSNRTSFPALPCLLHLWLKQMFLQYLRDEGPWTAVEQGLCLIHQWISCALT